MAKPSTGQKEQKERIARTESYAQKVKQEYASAVNDILALYKKLPKLKTGQMYSFDAQNSKLRSEASQVLRRLHANTLSTIKAGVSQEWAKANKAMDKLISNAVGGEALKDERLAGWFDRNEQALKAFMNRSDYGMNLSDRVWKDTQQFRDELEVAMTVAIGEGKSASGMSRKVRQYLNDPDLMFKRFRYKDDNGNWKTKWKKKVVDSDGKYHFIDYDRDSYKTGPGVYKSAYKNSMRLTRTETNMAYRTADHDRWQGLDFVLGQKIETSGSHTKEDIDICDELAGEYPKDFKFDGWHPQCYCICTPILTTEEDMEAEMQAALEGKPYTPKRKPITQYPKGFKDFLTNNKSKLQKAISAGKAPYFITNNMATVEAIFGGEEPPVTVAVETAPLQEPKEKPFKHLSVKELEDIGWEVIGDVGCYEKSLAYKMDLQGLLDDLSSIAMDNELELNQATLNIIDEDEFYLTFQDEEGDFKLKRMFYRDGEDKITVDHSLFKLSKELQGQGISKEVFKALYKQYLNLGVEKLAVCANIDVGGYTWARYGFRTTEAKWAIKNSKASEELKQQATAIVDEFYDDESNGKYFPMNLLVEKMGKEKAKLLLKGSGWDGTLDLTDAAQRETFEKYMGYERPLAEPTPSQPAKDEHREAILQKAQERHAARTPEQEKAIKDAWKKRQEKHAAIQQEAKFTLGLASGYKEISSGTLQKLINDNNLTKLPAETEKVKKAIAESKKAESALTDLIPDVHYWHKEFTIDELKIAYESVKKRLDSLASLPLEQQLSKLKYAEEYLGQNKNDIQSKTPTWKVSKAVYQNKIIEVVMEFKYNEIEKGLQEIDAYLQAHPKATKMVEQYEQIREWLDEDMLDYDEIKKEFDILNDTYKRRVASEKSRAKKKTGTETESSSDTNPFTPEAYTKERKDNAVWDTSYDKKKSLNTLHPEACKAWQAASEAEKDAAYEYTKNYSWTNKPLQGRKYRGPAQTRADFEERVKNIEKYVDRNELPCDMWFQRGDDDFNVVESRLMFRNPKAVFPKNIKDLVGMEIQEGGFMSTSSGKDGGFSNCEVIFNVYAPKGTKAAYVEPFSYYGKGKERAWDGKSKQSSVGGENETLFQRGTIMRITKVEEKRGRYYIDVEVIGQEKKDLSYVRDLNIHP